MHAQPIWTVEQEAASTKPTQNKTITNNSCEPVGSVQGAGIQIHPRQFPALLEFTEAFTYGQLRAGGVHVMKQELGCFHRLQGNVKKGLSEIQ